MSRAAVSSSSVYDSKLPTGKERFLSQLVVHALGAGWRTAEDFVRHFPPPVLIESLAKADELRSDLLIRAGKVHAKLAPKKSINSGSEDLSIALSEGLCSAQEILDVYGPDERVKYLPAPRLWAFLTEGNFFKSAPSDPDYDRALGRLVFTLERAIAEQLLAPIDLGEGLSFSVIAERLPLEAARRLALHSLSTGRSGRPLDEVSLLECIPLPELVSYIDLSHTWEHVVLARVARTQGFTVDGVAPAARVSPSSGTAKSAKAQGGAKSAGSTSSGSSSTSRSSVRPVSLTPTPAAVAPSPAPIAEGKPELAALLESIPPAPGERPAPYADVDDGELVEFDGDAVELSADELSRREAAERLRKVDRLPPSHAGLGLPLLLSIASMYEELDAAVTDDAREQVIRDSFPNETHLRQSMLALIELLDPSIDTSEPLIRDADIDSLIKIVLFEERRRWERSHPSQKAPHSIRPRPFLGSRPSLEDEPVKRR